MKTPSFWYKKTGVLSTLLSPLGWCYDALGTLRRFLKKSRKVSIPVISIGNIVSGGSGKTPVTLALVKALQEKGYQPHVVTRGYGGSTSGPIQVDVRHHTYKDVGDEALLLAACAPTWVSRVRYEGALCAQKVGATHVLLDDGHQHLSLHKDLSFVVVDGKQRFGNGCVIPAGPLRESVARGLSRADVVILVGEGGVRWDGPVFSVMPTYDISGLTKSSYVAFAGLGFPDKFFRALKEMGVEVVSTHEFPDHHPYSDAEMMCLLSDAKKNKARLLTTAKDKLRVPLHFREYVDILPLNMVLPSEIMSLVAKVTL